MKLFALLALALALVAGACSEDNEVGSGVDLNLKEAAGQGRLGERTTTTAAAATTVAPQKAGIAEATTTAKPTTTTAAPPTTEAPVPTFDIAVYGDTGGSSQFDPSQARVYAGTIVKWTNRDSKPRSVEADAGAFASGMLQPGQSFTWKAVAGTYNYHDGTRPYAVGYLEVLNP